MITNAPPKGRPFIAPSLARRRAQAHEGQGGAQESDQQGLGLFSEAGMYAYHVISDYMYVQMYIYTYMSMYAYMYICICIYMCIYIYMYVSGQSFSRLPGSLKEEPPKEGSLKNKRGVFPQKPGCFRSLRGRPLQTLMSGGTSHGPFIEMPNLA